MNLERWLQLRREGWIAAMPLGMSVAMAAFGDEVSAIDSFLDNGYGDGGYGPGNGNGHGCEIYVENGTITGSGIGNGYELKKNGNGYGIGYVYGNQPEDIARITQRFYEANR